MTAGLRFVQLTGADETAMRDGFRVRRAVQEHDRPGDSPPSWHSFTARPRWHYPGSRETMWAICDGAQPVGWCATALQQEDNRDVAQVEIEVHPEHRGRGVGQEVLRQLRPDLVSGGRTRGLFEVAGGSSGETFLRAAGARRVVADTQRRLEVGRLDVDGHNGLLRDAWAHATEYELCQWVGATPAGSTADIAVLHGRMSTDPPLDDLSWEPEVIDEAHVSARDEMMAAHGMRVYSAAARHRATDVVVGLTTLVVLSDVPVFGDQWETIVLPEHRGHRLGLALKIENLRHAMKHERHIQEVHTWNADSNEAMLAVNVAMGFMPVREWGEWELAL